MTNLLTKSGLPYDWGGGQGWFIIMRLLRPVHFAASNLFTSLVSKWFDFYPSVGLLSVIVLVRKSYRGKEGWYMGLLHLFS